jgi:hypothetical protein
MILAATLHDYCWNGYVADRDVCHDGCADRAGDKTETFIKCMLRVRKIAAENYDMIFGLEKLIHESTKCDENVTTAAQFLPGFFLRITDIVHNKQHLQSGCGHKMGNKIVGTTVVFFFHSCLS